MFITATGMICSVGLTAPSACAAMRAGVAIFEELPYRDNTGEPIIGAMVPDLPPGLRRDERLIELLAAALRDCLRSGGKEAWAEVPLLVGLAEPDRPGGGAPLADTVVKRVEEKLGVRFHPRLSAAIPQGHTAGFAGLEQARKMFNEKRAKSCLVAGVDSYINASALDWLHRHDRLKTAENSDGVIPGEAAAAVLVRRESPPGATSSVRISGLGFGKEEAHVLSEEPLLALGLATAVRSALAEAGVAMHEIEFRISDVSGESYGFKEQALALSRVMRVRREELPLCHTADSIGDTGAAAGVVQLIVVESDFKQGAAPGHRAMGYASAVPGNRAAVVLDFIKQSTMPRSA